jgi:hypothetical protein
MHDGDGARRNGNGWNRGVSSFVLAINATSRAFLPRKDTTASVGKGWYCTLRAMWKPQERPSSAICKPQLDGAMRQPTRRALGTTPAGRTREGFILTYRPPVNQAGLVKSMSGFALHRLKIDNSGSTVIFEHRSAEQDQLSHV